MVMRPALPLGICLVCLVGCFGDKTAPDRASDRAEDTLRADASVHDSHDLAIAYEIRVDVKRTFSNTAPPVGATFAPAPTALDKVVLVGEEPYFHAFVGISNEREIWVSPRLNHYFGRELETPLVRGPIALTARFRAPSYTLERLQKFAESAEAP
jgi:hypothetical protein